MGCHGSHAFSHSPNRLFMGIFFAFRGSQETILHQFKSVLGVQVCQIISLGSWFEATISLFLMFVYIFTLFKRFSLLFMNMQMK